MKTFLLPSVHASPWTVRQRVGMLLWETCWALFCGWTPKPFNRWRLCWLRAFGARLHGLPFVHQRARIQIPWNLTLRDRACLGDRCHVYNLAAVEIGERAVIAQEAYLCTGTHDLSDPALALKTSPIVIAADAFVGARAFLLPGVCLGRGAVVGACAVVTRDVEPFAIVAGNPPFFSGHASFPDALRKPAILPEPVPSTVPISIVIPIKNEAANLPRCLASVAWATQIFVVDSASHDGSPQIAHSLGAEVVQFVFNGRWPKKKNWALETLPFQHEWVFILDADEVLPPSAEQEFRDIVEDADHPVAGYWINRRFMFMGCWLRHAYYPNWNLRLFKHRLGRYEKLTDVDTQSGDNEVHEHVVVNGLARKLRCEMDHYAFPSVATFVEKHNRYSNWEARVSLDRFLQAAPPICEERRQAGGGA